MIKFSILVLTYNSKLEKILLTLESVLQQSFQDLEIIVADDGSKEDYSKEIEEYFKQNMFKNYTLIKNKLNIGTVENLLVASKRASGKYIKGIGPGDLLYHPNTLYDIYGFMEENQANFVYGEMQSYYISRPSLQVIKTDFKAPLNNIAYENISKTKALYNMLIKNDWISGSTMFFERSYLISKLEQIRGTVKYCEDLMQVLVCLENEKIYHYPYTAIWYEFGEGISTSGSLSKRLLADHQNFSALLNQIDDNKIIQKAQKNMELNSIRNLFARRALYLFYNPTMLIYKLKIKLIPSGSNKMDTCTGFLDSHEFRTMINDYFKN